METGYPKRFTRDLQEIWPSDRQRLFKKHQSFDAAGAEAGAPGAGASWTGADAAGACFGAAGFFAAASAGAAAAPGRGDGIGAFAAAGDAGGRGADAVVPGSGVMMLTGGVEAAEGKSALVGLPDGIDGARVATGAIVTGAFHDGA